MKPSPCEGAPLQGSPFVKGEPVRVCMGKKRANWKAIATLRRCAEFGHMHVHHGALPFPDLERS